MYSSQKRPKDPTVMEYTNPEETVYEKKHSETMCQKYSSCRWALAYLCLSGRMCQSGIRQSIAMAIVCVTPDPHAYSRYTITNDQNSSWIKMTTDAYNGTGLERNKTGRFTVDWNSEEKGSILAANAYGVLFSSIIGGYLTGKMGYKLIIGVAMVTSAITSLMTPFGIVTNPYIVVILRVIDGLFQGLSVPGFRGIWGVWAPKHERTQLAIVTYSGTDIGTIVAFGASGYFCNLSLMGGWPLLFYMFGSFNIAWLLLWGTCVADSPEAHPWISDEEKQIFKGHTNGNSKRKMLSTPWLAIMRSGPLWAIFVASICNQWGKVVLQIMLPQYMRDVLRFNMAENGMVSMIPFCCRFFGRLSSSYFADYVLQTGVCTTGTGRKIFQCTGALIPAALIIGVGFLDYNNRSYAVILLTLSITINSFTDSAFRVNHLDIAPNFASLIGGINLSFSQIPGIIAPYVTSMLTPNGTHKEWQHVFLNCACIYIFGAIFFTVFGDGEEQEWAKDITEAPPLISDPVKNGKSIVLDENDKEATESMAVLLAELLEKIKTVESDIDSGCGVSMKNPNAEQELITDSNKR